MQAFPADSVKDLLAVKDPHSWGVDAFKLAVDKIYSYTKFNKKITQEYQDDIRKVLYKQLALGGYRLAIAIQSIFA